MHEMKLPAKLRAAVEAAGGTLVEDNGYREMHR